MPDARPVPELMKVRRGRPEGRPQGVRNRVRIRGPLGDGRWVSLAPGACGDGVAIGWGRLHQRSLKSLGARLAWRSVEPEPSRIAMVLAPFLAVLPVDALSSWVGAGPAAPSLRLQPA